MPQRDIDGEAFVTFCFPMIIFCFSMVCREEKKEWREEVFMEEYME